MCTAFQIFSAPLQGFTDYAFCAAHQKVIGGVDRYFTPYVVLENDGSIKGKYTRELQRFAQMKDVVPQVLPASVDELKLLLDFLGKQGFSRVNINAGCPYPMVMNRGRGAALLAKPYDLMQMVDVAHSTFQFEVGIKTRLGIDACDKAEPLAEMLDFNQLTEWTVHARTARQMYKGDVQIQAFEVLIQRFPLFRWFYNGDIDSVECFRNFQNLLPPVSGYMFGRGLLMNPFLAIQCVENGRVENELWAKLQLEFLLTYFDLIVDTSNDAKHAMNRVTAASEYFSQMYMEPHKLRKALKKSRTLDEMRFALQNFNLKINT
jgi:tRNA-dihydrouridine synthase